VLLANLYLAKVHDKDFSRQILGYNECVTHRPRQNQTKENQRREATLINMRAQCSLENMSYKVRIVVQKHKHSRALRVARLPKDL